MSPLRSDRETVTAGPTPRSGSGTRDQSVEQSWERDYHYLTDRKSYMIISGGVNICPQEAENLLATHPDVYDVAVIGVPDEEFGEQVKSDRQAGGRCNPRRGRRGCVDPVLPGQFGPLQVPGDSGFCR